VPVEDQHAPSPARDDSLFAMSRERLREGFRDPPKQEVARRNDPRCAVFAREVVEHPDRRHHEVRRPRRPVHPVGVQPLLPVSRQRVSSVQATPANGATKDVLCCRDQRGVLRERHPGLMLSSRRRHLDVLRAVGLRGRVLEGAKKAAQPCGIDGLRDDDVTVPVERLDLRAAQSSASDIPYGSRCHEPTLAPLAIAVSSGKLTAVPMPNEDRERFLYLTTIGRTSGLPRTIEIWFVERAGKYYVVSERREEAGWVKNLARDPAVHVRIGTREEAGSYAPASARIVREPELVADVASLMNAKYGWSDGLVVEIAPHADQG
jgi:deazaflavin-dependent oxidoreductase (nitroreductase family)